MRERIEAIIATGATAGFTLANIETALKFAVLALCGLYWLAKASIKIIEAAEKIKEVIKRWRESRKK